MTPKDLAGELVGSRYRLGKVVGERGTGTLYSAEDEEGGGKVVIKVLTPSLAPSSKARKRFEREAFATARVEHPNIIKVLDIGTLGDGRLFLAMESTDDETLAERLAGGALPLERALRIAAQILRGLEHAHELGVVHRDLSPEKVLIEPGTDSVKIVDFGLAKLLGDAGVGGEQLTQSILSMGNSIYMAPERLSGAAIDGRADLYAVAMLLFEMIAGQPPFEPERLEQTAEFDLRDELPTIADVAGIEVPEEIEALVRRGLEADPSARIASAGEFLAEILKALGEEEASAEPASVALGAPTGPSDIAATTVFDSARSALPAASARGRLPNRYKVALAALGVIALIGLIAHLASDGRSTEEPGGASSDSIERIIEAWSDADLEPGGFAPVDGAALNSESCHGGAIAGLDVTLCEYEDDAGASGAKGAGVKLVGNATGAAVAGGELLLVVSDRKGADPSGKTINEVIVVFRKTAAPQ